MNAASDLVGKFWQPWAQALEPHLGFSPKCARALMSLCLGLFYCEMGTLLEPVAGDRMK